MFTMVQIGQEVGRCSQTLWSDDNTTTMHHLPVNVASQLGIFWLLLLLLLILLAAVDAAAVDATLAAAATVAV